MTSVQRIDFRHACVRVSDPRAASKPQTTDSRFKTPPAHAPSRSAAHGIGQVHQIAAVTTKAGRTLMIFLGAARRLVHSYRIVLVLNAECGNTALPVLFRSKPYNTTAARSKLHPGRRLRVDATSSGSLLYDLRHTATLCPPTMSADCKPYKRNQRGTYPAVFTTPPSVLNTAETQRDSLGRPPTPVSGTYECLTPFSVAIQLGRVLVVASTTFPDQGM